MHITFFLRRILNQREKFEYRLMRRDKQKTDYTAYINFLKSVIRKVKKVKLILMLSKFILKNYFFVL